MRSVDTPTVTVPYRTVFEKVSRTIPLVSGPSYLALQGGYSVVALCAPLSFLQLENLRSFALHAAFPRSLDGRCSIDYYERSVIWSDFQALQP